MKGAHFVAAVAFMFASTKFDYTFWMNLVALGVIGWLSWLNYSWLRHNKAEAMEMAGGGKIKKTAALIALGIIAVGNAIHLFLTLA